MGKKILPRKVIIEDTIGELYKIVLVAKDNYNVYKWYRGEFEFDDNVSVESAAAMVRDAMAVYVDVERDEIINFNDMPF